jgi:hypothetical protein
MGCSSTALVLVPRRALILGFRGFPGNPRPQVFLAAGILQTYTESLSALVFERVSMSPSQTDSACEQPAATEPIRLGIEPERRPMPYPEGLPLMSLLAAALISFAFLATASWSRFPFLMDFVIVGGGLGPLLLPVLSDSVLLEALVGTAFLTIITLTILLAERQRRFPDWLPFVASFPVAWGLTLPSALELGGTLLAWLVFGAMVAGVFCLHWRVFTWARVIWD